MSIDSVNKINIRPGVSILSVLKHLNYKPWYALAEFVDNSVQSYLDHKAELTKIEGDNYILKVHIDVDTSDSGKITIRDNAAGIYRSDYERAFRPAAIPPDRSGLNEFGMGMKSSACWFSENFIVRTAALGEEVAREVVFDVNKIIEDSLEELEITSDPKDANIHFTTIVLTKLHRMLAGRTISKIKEHLASIYREFIRNGTLELYINEELLEYVEPKILTAAYFKDDFGLPLLWKKEISFDFGNGLSVSGFAAIRETGSTSAAGFSLFRKSRVIQGSGDEGYRPEYIFKKATSFSYQRLFGELHLEGFEVSHTKDGFRWEDNEEVFLELLAEHLDSPPIPLLKQAEGYRVNPKPGELKKAAETATAHTAKVIGNEIPKVIESQLLSPPDSSVPQEILPESIEALERVISLEVNGKPWEITLNASIDPSLIDWLDISDQPNFTNNIWKVGIRMSLMHPFMTQFCGSDPEKLEILLRMAAAIVIAEVTARQSGVKQVGTVRRNINQLLREAFSKP